MLSYILIGVAVLLVGFLVIVAMQPADFKVVRSAAIQASPATLFEQVNDFHNWKNWSPWAKLDPNMTETHEGSPSGEGAIYSWLGNSKVGQGRMTMLESHPTDRLRIKLEFLKPFVATNEAVFTFQSQGNQTLVSWTMTGRKNFLFKAFCMFMNMDKTVGGDFEKGLAQMKALAEQS